MMQILFPGNASMWVSIVMEIAMFDIVESEYITDRIDFDIEGQEQLNNLIFD